MITTQETALGRALWGFQKALKYYSQVLGSLSALTSLGGQPACLSQPPKQENCLKARDAARLIRGSLGNCLAVVVRYFGGVKLGVVRAYGQSVSRAALTAKTILVEPKCSAIIDVPFEREAQCRHILHQYGADVVAVSYSHHVELIIHSNMNETSDLAHALANATHGKAAVRWM